LTYFIENPRATGEAAQKALVSGKLDGKEQPPMGIGLLFKIKRQAEAIALHESRGMSRDAAVKLVTEESKLKAGRDEAPVVAKEAAQAIFALREAAAVVQELLGRLDDIHEVRISRAGASVIRRVTREDAL
jgi:hypothetical protein